MDPLLRILDANANRAREALRVMEDAARFALEDNALIEGIKSLRHELRIALSQPAIDRALLLSARGSTSDPGRDIKTDAELSRQGLPDIAAAAASRLTEALRSIEESAKALGADPRPIELLRYQAYEAEKQLSLRLATGRARQWRLCILITESLCTPHHWLEVARAAIAGGADCLQLREKGLDGRELLHRARTLRAIAHEPRCSLIINDRPDIALLAGADGVHLGQTDLAAEEARKLVGFRLLIGVSTTNLEQARSAAQAGADYCGVGAMFATTTKHKPQLSGAAYLRQYVGDAVASQRPHLAIGGITPENLPELVAAGCRGIAVSNAVCSAPDPEAVCRSLIAGLGASAAAKPGAPPAAR